MSDKLKKMINKNHTKNPYVSRLHTFINESHDTIELTFDSHTFTFATEPDAVIYTVSIDGTSIKTQRVDLDGSGMLLADMLAKDTYQSVPDNEDNVAGTQYNIVHIHRVLQDLISHPVNFEMDKRYVSLIKHLERLDEPFIMTYGDVATTIRYTGMMVCVSTRVPDQFVRTTWFGRGSKSVDIAEAISGHYDEIHFPALLPNHLLVFEMIEDLSGYFLTE